MESSLPPTLPSQPAPLPLVQHTLRRRASSLRKALVGLGVCAGAMFGLLILIGLGFEFGLRDLHITMLMAFVPVPFYIFLVLWLDRMEKEPAFLLALAFFYGATFATCLASIPNMLIEHAAGRNFAVLASAPIGEEFLRDFSCWGCSCGGATNLMA